MRRDYETLAALLQSYRIPLLILGVGLFLSFTAFFIAVYSGAQSRQSEFRRLAGAHAAQLQLGFLALNRELEEGRALAGLNLDPDAYAQLHAALVAGGSAFVLDLGIVGADGRVTHSAAPPDGPSRDVVNVLPSLSGQGPRPAVGETLIARLPAGDDRLFVLAAARSTGRPDSPWTFVVADLTALAYTTPVAERPLDAQIRLGGRPVGGLFQVDAPVETEAAAYRTVWAAPSPFEDLAFEFVPDRSFVMAVGPWPWIVLGVGLMTSFILFALAFREAQIGIQIRDEVETKTEALRRSHEVIKAKNAELARFAAHASHDLQAPLRAMKGIAELLAKGDRHLDPSTLALIERLQGGADRAQRLVQDLLSYTRADHAQPKREVIDFDALREEVESMLEAPIQESGARLVWNCDGTLIADSFLVSRLVTNLVSNSLKYRSDAAPVVRIASWRDGADAVLVVEDNGIGVAPTHHERIFGVFERLHSRDKYEGSGLGLAMCRRVAELHGGRIWMESELGQGARVFVRFPGAAQRPAEASSPKTAAGSGGGRGS